MLRASPVGLTYLVCIITVAGVAAALKEKKLNKATRVFYGIGLILVMVACLVFVAVSFVLLYPSEMLPFAPPRDWMDGVFMFVFVGFWLFALVGTLFSLLT